LNGLDGSALVDRARQLFSELALTYDLEHLGAAVPADAAARTVA
jgi:hypothetical protein